LTVELEIWGKAQRESARRPKSDWGRNFEGWNSPGSKVTWPAHKCISIRKTRTIDLGWVNISRVVSGVSGPKFTKFFYSTQY